MHPSTAFSVLTGGLLRQTRDWVMPPGNSGAAFQTSRAEGALRKLGKKEGDPKAALVVILHEEPYSSALVFDEVFNAVTANNRIKLNTAMA